MKFKKISISMDAALYVRLQKAAALQKRTFSNFISHIAETMLPAYERKSDVQVTIKARTKGT